MSLEIYEDDDATLVSDLAVTNLEAGVDSDTIPLHLWADKGNPGGTDEVDILLLLYTEDPGSPGTWLRTGIAPQDEQWGRARLVGHDNTADSSQGLIVTDWQPLGAYSGLLIPSIFAGCARYIELVFRPPASATATNYRWRLAVDPGSKSVPLPAGLAALERGVLTGVGDFSRSGLVRGGAVTATGTPDDEVHVAAVLGLVQGTLVGAVASDHALNQNDSAAAALTSGQSYKAVLSLGASGVVATKGTKGASPQAPAVPAGHVYLGTVTVEYQAGGTSVIDSADLAGDAAFDRHRAVAGSGLELIVHPGQALGGTLRRRSDVEALALTGSATNYVWQLASGLYELTTTAAPPTPDALLLWEADTDGSGITALRDRRTYAGRHVVLSLSGASPGSHGDIADVYVAHEHLQIESFIVRVSDDGSGTGSTIVGFEINGTTAFTSSGTDDQRPTFPVGTSDLVLVDAIPELLSLRRGDILSLVADGLPSTAGPALIEAHWICREV